MHFSLKSQYSAKLEMASILQQALYKNIIFIITVLARIV